MIKQFRKATDTLRELVAYYLIVMIVAATLFCFVENVSFWESLYWAGITITTTGYGDISPHTLAGRILSVVLANVGVFVFGPLIIAKLLGLVVENPDHFSHAEQEDIKTRMVRLEQLLWNLTPEDQRPKQHHGFDLFGHDWDPDNGDINART